MADQSNTDHLPVLPITFQTVMLGGGFPPAMARMCSHCFALVPMTDPEATPDKIAPEKLHAQAHAAMLATIAFATPEQVAEQLAPFLPREEADRG